MLALVTASTASLEPVAVFPHGVMVMALGGLQPTSSIGGSGGGASAVEMVYLGVYSGTSAAARVSGLEHSSAAPAGTHGRHRWWLVAVVEAKTVLNWAVRVWERVEAASSAANVRLALAVAGVTRKMPVDCLIETRKETARGMTETPRMDRPHQHNRQNWERVGGSWLTTKSRRPTKQES